MKNIHTECLNTFLISPLYQYIRDFSEDSAPSGAGEGIRGVLQNLFNDQNHEANLLAFQLELLKNNLNYISNKLS